MSILTNNYDYIFLAIIIVSLVISLFRGGIKEILSTTTWIMSFVFTKLYGNIIMSKLPEFISNHFIRIIITFVMFFVVIAVIMAVVNKLIKALFDNIGLGSIDYMIACLFGIIRGMIFCSILIILIEMMHLDRQHGWQHTKLYPILKPVFNIIVDLVPKINNITNN